MSFSAPFVHRPVGTTLLTAAVTLAGALAYFHLPVAPLPQVDFPTIQVSATLPGASPATMASAVATPLERQFGQIAGVTEMTSTSFLGMTSITLQFDLDRDIDGAARDVQAAINSARGRLPANLPSNPMYRKVNPADAPVMILTLTSETYSRAEMYDAASSILQQKLAQASGVGQVIVGGGSPPGVRVDLNPTVLNHLGIGLDDVRLALAGANARGPKGQVADERTTWSIDATDQRTSAAEYAPLIVVYRAGAAVRLSDLGVVSDSVEDTRASGLFDGRPSISLIVFRQPGANIIDTCDRIRAMLPRLQAQIPADMELFVALDRTNTIRASVRDVQTALAISVCLVILVVFLFLRDARATFIPSVAVPVSLVGTFGVMYLAGFSVDNLSLMALTIATGFVVDDAIVVIENVSRRLAEGFSPLEAALRGAREIGFTVLSISVSLVAVFIPILFMSGIVGRLFRQFAITLSAAIVVSLLVSLTSTPMLCATLLKNPADERRGRWYRTSERVFEAILWAYAVTLRAVLRHRKLALFVTLSTVGFTVYLYVIVPKGFFPQQDTGRLVANLQADQDASFLAMEGLLARFAAVVSEDPAVDHVTASTGGMNGAGNTGRMFVTLKPLAERRLSADAVAARIRTQTAKLPGASLFVQAVQDLRIGGRSSGSQYQYTIRGDDLGDLNAWGPKIVEEMRKLPGLIDVNTDQQNRGLQTAVDIDRDAAARLGVTQRMIDDALYDAFGQRQVSTIYQSLNQYHVVMAVQPEFWRNADALDHIYLRSPEGGRVPLSAVGRHAPANAPILVNHSGLFPSATVSFNLAPGASLGDAVLAIEDMTRSLGLPATMQGSFQGTAQAYQASVENQPWLILAALVTVYIVLGVLYESYIHPLTILSTIPSAGVGAILALLLCGMELDVMALIGVLLLIGIVKKNAIMMIDFALDAERRQGKSADAAIVEACLLRFRPIVMTTLAALLGGLPLALGAGAGAEIRRPLGVAIVGGLLFSQVLTLYTTPIVYLYLDRFRLRRRASPA